MGLFTKILERLGLKKSQLKLLEPPPAGASQHLVHPLRQQHGNTRRN
jgi:hypothetical protein